MTCTLFILLVISILNLQAQDYLISFAGSGASTTIATVKVENLTQGTSLLMNGSDVLHLMGVVTGIETVIDNETGKISFYPSPMKDYAKMVFNLPESGKVLITLYDLSGREIAQTRNLLSKGQHTYRIQDVEEGAYFVRISSGKYSLSGRLISSGSQNRSVRIVYENTLAAVDDKQSDSKGKNAETVMQYTTGDRLKFTGISGNYSTVTTDVPTTNKTITFNFMPCTDHDNNNYPIVEIGNQTWMAINLKTTTYNNGDLIGTTTPATLAIWNEPSPKYQWAYAGEESNVALYGRLYTWYAITDSRSVCPAGWYVSTDGDWTILTTFLGGNGGALKETGTTHWTIPNVLATDKAGFTALPGGWHYAQDGSFRYLGNRGSWLSTSEYSITYAWIRELSYDYFYVTRTSGDKNGGFSVRCLKVSVPKITTAPVETFGATTATVGGEVITHGGAAVTDRGVYYGTAQNPVTTGMKLQIGSGEGTFTTDISGLIPNTTYYVTAYVTNSVGTSYGDEKSFKTEPTRAVLTTAEVTSITQTTAISGGNITYDGGTNVTARGVCWSTGQYPNLYSNHTSDGTGSGVFISNLTGLTINTKYYIRAYAINSAGYQYGDQRTFATKGATGTVTDVDGNTYSTIQIGTQTWMAENLKTTKFRGGTSIHNITDNTQWESSTAAAYCWYNNDINNKNIYGALYNYYAVTVNGGVLCPTGWHVPTDGEWTTLTDYLGGSSVAGGKLKEAGTTHWTSPNTGATNETGFTALPGGRRNSYGGAFWTLGTGGFWWSATVGTWSNKAWRCDLSYYYNSISRFENDWKDGYSIRCLKD